MASNIIYVIIFIGMAILCQSNHFLLNDKTCEVMEDNEYVVYEIQCEFVGLGCIGSMDRTPQADLSWTDWTMGVY